MSNEVLISTEGDVLRVISPEGLHLYEMSDAAYPRRNMPDGAYAVHDPDTDEVIGWYVRGVEPPMGWAEVPKYGWREFGRDALLILGVSAAALWLFVEMVEEWVR